MSLKHWFIFFIFSSLIISCKSSNPLMAQDSTDMVKGYKLWLTDVRSISKDKLDNIYILDEENAITKYDNGFKSRYQYSSQRLGDAACVDVTNPLQIIVYYPDFQVVKTLDNTLAETGTFDLTDLDLVDVDIVALSNDNKLWIYNEVESKLIKVNRSGKMIIESDRMDLLFPNIMINPTQIIERENLVMVFDPEQGLFVFDNFGQYAYWIDQLKGGSIHFFQDQLVHVVTGNIDIWNIELRIKKRMEEGQIKKNADNILFLSNGRVLQIGNKVYYSE